jgi:hypothetical protein
MVNTLPDVHDGVLLDNCYVDGDDYIQCPEIIDWLERLLVITLVLSLVIFVLLITIIVIVCRLRRLRNRVTTATFPAYSSI